MSWQHTIALLDSEEGETESGNLLQSRIQASQPDAPSLACVRPQWLAETYKQRRRLPLEAFCVFVDNEAVAEPAKKRRVEGAATARYAWKSDATAKLQDLANDSREREKQEKHQQRVTEGLRLAELRREPSNGNAQ